MLLCLSVPSGRLQAQVGFGNNKLLAYATIQDGDTIPIFHLETVNIVTKWALLTDKEIKKNQKLIRNVRKTLPYAKEARRRLQEIERRWPDCHPPSAKLISRTTSRRCLPNSRQTWKG